MQPIFFRAISFSLCSLFILFFIFHGETGGFPGWKDWQYYLLAVGAGNGTGFILVLLNQQAGKAFSWELHTYFRLLTSFAINCIAAVVFGLFLSMLLLIIVTPLTNIAEIWEGFHEQLIKLGILIFLCGIFFTIVHFAISAFNHFNTTKIKEIRSKREQLKYQFEALKTQLSPHYLFNCLNTISSLAFKDPKTAESFIRKLSDTYNYLLKSDEKMLVALHEELDFVEKYIFLQNIRFNNSIRLERNIPDNILENTIPPLSVQIVVENAIKHNTFSKDRPLHILLTANNTRFMRVINNLAVKDSTTDSFKIGINNIKGRYSFFTDDKVVLRQKNNFEVRLPLLSKNINPLTGEIA